MCRCRSCFREKILVQRWHGKGLGCCGCCVPTVEEHGVLDITDGEIGDVLLAIEVAVVVGGGECTEEGHGKSDPRS